MNYNEDLNSNLIGDIVDNNYEYNEDCYFGEGVEDSLDDLLSTYNKREFYIKDMLESFDRKDTGIESQILDLFNNVKNLLLNKDISLIKNSIYSISSGRENALRFLNDQKDNLDESTIKIMNVIINEYSTHLVYLNKALNILE